VSGSNNCSNHDSRTGHFRRTAKSIVSFIFISLTLLSSIAPQIPGIVGGLIPAQAISIPGPNISGKFTQREPVRVPLPAGSIQTGVRASPSYALAVDSSISPRLAITPDSYQYQTSYGLYSFNKTFPYIFTLQSRSAVPLTKGSMFSVAAHQLLTTGSANVTLANDNEFQVYCQVLSGNSSVGRLLLQVNFQTSAPPKFTLSFSKTASWSLGDFNIVWTTFPVHEWLKTGRNQAMSLGSLSNQTLSSMGSAAFLLSQLRTETGPSDDPSLWTEWVTTDWTDSPGGRLRIDQVRLASLFGMAQIVDFQTNQATIDPTQISTSTVTVATAYSTQRKTFSFGGFYFLFYYTGSNIVYFSSKDQNLWAGPYVAAAGPIGLGGGFDMFNSGSTVALDWLNYNPGAGGDGTTQLLFRSGTVVGGSISWQPVATVANLPQPYSYTVSVAIGTDGTFWASGVWYTAPPPTYIYHVWIYKSSDGLSFTESTDYGTANTGSRMEAVQLVSLSGGRLLALSSHYYYSSIRWTTWNPTTGAWSPVQTNEMNMLTSTGKANLFSAATTPDGLVHLIFQRYSAPPIYYLAWAYYNFTQNQWTIDSQVVNVGNNDAPIYPSLSSDSLGNLYAFYTFQTSGGLYYGNRPPGVDGWSYQTPFGPISNPTWISTSRSTSKMAIVAWTQGGTSPNKILYGSLPLPPGVASGPPIRPWSKLGLSPYEQYFTQNGEYVSPGNGMLTVSQTDISVPGRNGLNLAVARTYVQPFTLVPGSPWPFNYESSPYAMLGYGWRLNLPYVEAENNLAPHSINWLNGELFPIFWDTVTQSSSGDFITTYSMTNHQTEDFVFTETWDHTTGSLTYQLLTKDGTTYNFNGNGWINTVVDRTGQNKITFTYNNGFIASITDTVGRVATFKYNANWYLANVTYGGQTVKYAYSGNNLISATDAAGRVIRLSYAPQSIWLLSGVTYATGGNSAYTYGNTTIGTDAVNYYVTRQNIYAGTLVKSSSFSYAVTDGEVTYASVSQSDGVSIQGYTNYLFNAPDSSMTRTVLNGTGAQMLQDQFWYDSKGRLVQDDTATGTHPWANFSNSRFYDLWGNIIYTRDNIGQESYQSFANTDTQSTFQGPGSLSTTTSGRLFYDDFNGPSLNTYTWGTGGSAVGRSATVSGSLLTLKGASTAQGTWQSSWVYKTMTDFPIYGEVQVAVLSSPGTNTISGELILSPNVVCSTCDPFGASDQLRFVVNDGPLYQIIKTVAGVSTVVWSDSGGGTESVSWKFILIDRNTLTAYLNRGYQGSGFVQVFSTTSLGLGSAFSNPKYVYLDMGNSNTNSYAATFDYFGVTSSNTINVNGLQSGQKVELYDWNDALKSSGIVSSGSTSLALDATQMVFPYGYLKIYGQDGATLQFTSPIHEFWGGSSYSYTQPFKSQASDTRTTSGFLQSASVYVDDSVPSGATQSSDGGDSWSWVGSPVVSGTVSHQGTSTSGEHQHYFYGASTPMNPVSGNFHIQYVYIPSASVPSEIMLQFHDNGNHILNGGFEAFPCLTYWATSGALSCATISHSGTHSAESAYSPQSQTWKAFTLEQDFSPIPGSSISAAQFWYLDGQSNIDSAMVVYSDGSTSTPQALNPVSSWTLMQLSFDTSKQVKGIKVVRSNFTFCCDLYLDDFSVQTAASWEHRAYWGTNSIGWGTDGTVSRRHMGPIPTPRDSWAMLMVKTDDVGTPSINIDGLAYTLYNGGVYWDYSATGAPSTGTMTVNGLLPNQKAELDDSGGAVRSSYIVPAGGTSATLDLYSASINSFPFAGYLKIYGSVGFLQYTSPLKPNTWSGDVYTYTQPPFSNSFNPGPVGGTIHNLLIGAAQFQSASSTPEEAYSNYDSLGNLLQTNLIHNGSPLTYTYTYDTYGNTLSQVNPINERTNFVYNSAYQSGFLTNTTQVMGSSPDITTSFVPNFATGQRMAIIDAMGNKTSYAYDSIGRATSITEPLLGGSTAAVGMEYQDSINSFGIENEKANYTDFFYDGLGRITQVNYHYGDLSSPIIANESFTYDWQGNVRSHRATSGYTTTYAYDYLGRLTKVTNPDGTSQRTYYDDFNLIRTIYDENSHRTDKLFDANQRLIGVRAYYTASAYYLTSYYYDRVGNLAKSVDGNGQVTTYAYDDLNRLVSTTYPDGLSETRTYNNIGNIVSKTDPNSKTTTYSYDNSNRLTAINYQQDGTTATFGYDKNDNRISLSYLGNSATFSYDSKNRLISETWTIAGRGSYLVTRSYDSVGNPTAITYPDGTFVTYSYDPLNRISTVKDGPTTLASLSYNADSTINSILYGNGVQTKFTRDTRSRPTRISTTNGATSLMDLNYVYDSAGNVLGINTESYSYDALDRLTSATGPWGTLKYGYDPVGNRLWSSLGASNTTYTYGNYDRLSSYGATTYTYDNNGNLKTQASSGVTTTYAYDMANRLTSIIQGGSTVGSYVYDADGRRIEKTESSTSTIYLNQGTHVLYESQIGSLSNDYVYAGDELIAKVSGASIQYFHHDILGSTRLVTTGSTTSFSTNYQPFGSQFGTTGTDPTYKYTGKAQDTATGLYYYSARYLDPTIGRFISRDPASPQLCDGQSLNPYSYARNNPERFNDPTGACVSALDFAFDIVGLVLDIVGVPQLNGKRDLVDIFQLGLEVADYLRSYVNLLLNKDVLGFLWDVIPPILYKVGHYAIQHLSWIAGLVLAAEVASSTLLWRVIYGLINFAFAIVPQVIAPPAGFCLDKLGIGDISLTGGNGSGTSSSSSTSPSTPPETTVSSGAGGTFPNTSAGVSAAIQENVATYGRIGIVAVTGPYGEVITPGV